MTDTNITSDPKRNKYKVLIAEDDYSISNLLKMGLELAGYKVITAINGTSALNQITSSKPDFILMDINMPELNGFEVIDEAKKKGLEMPGKKLLFLTNSSSSGDITKAKNYSANYRIKAEISPKQLVAFIDEQLKI